jgi:hypothetical protein
MEGVSQREHSAIVMFYRKALYNYGMGTAGVSCSAALESTEGVRASLPRVTALGGAVALVITVHRGAIHNAIDRKKLFMMKAFHHPSGSQ